MTAALPPRPQDGGGLPLGSEALAERIRNAPDLLLEATLEREESYVRVLRSRLEHAQKKVAVLEAERARRRGVKAYPASTAFDA